MSVKIAVTGREKLIGGPNGFSGDLSVSITGGPASMTFAVPVQNAASRDGAVSRALIVADTFGKELRFQASREHALLEGVALPDSMFPVE
jgi:hypothetical protein